MNKISDDPVIILTITCMQECCNSNGLKCGRFNLQSLSKLCKSDPLQQNEKNAKQEEKYLIRKLRRLIRYKNKEMSFDYIQQGFKFEIYVGLVKCKKKSFIFSFKFAQYFIANIIYIQEYNKRRKIRIFYCTLIQLKWVKCRRFGTEKV